MTRDLCTLIYLRTLRRMFENIGPGRRAWAGIQYAIGGAAAEADAIGQAAVEADAIGEQQSKRTQLGEQQLKRTQSGSSSRSA